MSAAAVKTGPVVELPLSPWVVRFMPEHEGGPWVCLGLDQAEGGFRAFASMPVSPGFADELRVLADVIEGTA